MDVAEKAIKREYSAFIGVLTPQLRLPRPILIPLLRVLDLMDRSVVGLGLIHGSNIVLRGEKMQ